MYNMELREKFLKAYANVPEDLRGDIIVVIKREPYSWQTSFLEIKDNTEKGKEILNMLKSMRML
jgi:hypothetical protein